MITPNRDGTEDNHNMRSGDAVSYQNLLLEDDDNEEEDDDNIFDDDIDDAELRSVQGSIRSGGNSGQQEFKDLSNVLAESSKGKRSSAVKMFNQFLAASNIPHTLITIPKVLFTKSLFGKFPDFMMNLKEPNSICCQTNVDYLSHIKCIWQDTNPRHFDNAIGAASYKKLRRNVRNAYLRRCIAQKIPFATAREAMTADHLDYLLKVCFRSDTLQSIRDRCLMAFDWCAIGRINEVYNFRLDEDVVWEKASQSANANRMVFKMLRGKTGVLEDLLVYPHRNNWIVCPFHSLACLLVVLKRDEGRLFTDNEDSSTGEAQHVNRVLKSIYEAWKQSSDKEGVDGLKKYVTHEIRHGSASHCNEHPLMQTAWLLFQGGWALDKVQTLFNYLAGSVKIASKAGLAMSSWEALESCGFCPGAYIVSYKNMINQCG
jgi:hypothetical protein